MLYEFQDKGAVLAGGTDLLVNMKKGKASPKHVVTLSRIEELKGIKRDHGSLSIGASVTVADLKECEDVKSDFSGLSEGAGSLGSPLIRNLATTGGNIVTARPAADLPPPLIAYGASLVLKKENGERVLRWRNSSRAQARRSLNLERSCAASFSMSLHLIPAVHT